MARSHSVQVKASNPRLNRRIGMILSHLKDAQKKTATKACRFQQVLNDCLKTRWWLGPWIHHLDLKIEGIEVDRSPLASDFCGKKSTSIETKHGSHCDGILTQANV